jgi:hypothetical protein
MYRENLTKLEEYGLLGQRKSGVSEEDIASVFRVEELAKTFHMNIKSNIYKLITV